MLQSFILKVLVCLIVLDLIGLSPTMAQQNGEFESWSPSGQPPPFDWIYPTGWTTTNAATEFITAGVTRNADAHNGSYAAQIKTLNIFGTLTRSQLALGTCKLDFPSYQLLGHTGGEPLPMLPQKITFFYKLMAGNLSEYAVADILVKRTFGITGQDTVFHESIHLQAASEYTEVTHLIPDVDIHPETDSIVIVFSSNDINETDLNILYVDDVSIDFTSALHDVSLSGSSISVYPNPVRSGEVLTMNYPVEGWHDVKIFDIMGRLVQSCVSVSHDGSDTTFEWISAQPGVYSLITDGKYGVKFVVGH